MTDATTRLLSAGALDEALDPLELAADSVLAGSPATTHRSLVEDGGPEVGIWELTPGTVTDVETDEVFVVLAGAGSVTFADGSRIDLAPGVVVRLHAGDETTWHVTRTLRKVYVG